MLTNDEIRYIFYFYGQVIRDFIKVAKIAPDGYIPATLKK
jgi:hypothetical protein